MDSQADLDLDHFAGNRCLIIGEVLDEGVVRTEFLRKNSTQSLYRQGLSGAGRQGLATFALPRLTAYNAYVN